MSNYKFWVVRLGVVLFIVLIVTACQTLEQTGSVPTTELAQAVIADVAAVSAQETKPAAVCPTTECPTPGPTAFVTVVVTATDAPETAVSEPTSTPAAPVPTATSMPTSTPLPDVAPPAWLSYFNRFRDLADLPPVSEQNALTLGSNLHSRYIVVNDAAISHSESKDNPLYDPSGDRAARNGNIFATSQTDATYIWGVNFWVSAPFHLLSMIHPGLSTIGYGDHVEDTGDVRMASVMDVRSAREYSPEGATYPIYFPKNGGETWIVRLSMYEWPEPYGNCSGYSYPSGPAIALQLGDGRVTPRVISHSMMMGDQPIESCVFDETNYRNANSYAQEVGRTILDIQDAVIILPKKPLAIDQTYTVEVVLSDETYVWSFRTRKGPP